MQKLWLWHAPHGKFNIGVNAFNAVLRLVLTAVAAWFAVGSVVVGMRGSGPVGALWLFVIAAVVFCLWNLWDVAKSWGWIPAARVLIGESEIAFETPFWRRTFMSETFTVGEPLELEVREHAIIKAAKTMHVYEFHQGDVKARYLAPMYMTYDSAEELRQALARKGTRLKMPYISR